jgi:hypothetical protein
MKRNKFTNSVNMTREQLVSKPRQQSSILLAKQLLRATAKKSEILIGKQKETGDKCNSEAYLIVKSVLATALRTDASLQRFQSLDIK